MSNWDEIYSDELALDPNFNIEIPIDRMPGEEAEDWMLRYFYEAGILTGDDPENLLINWKLAASIDENYVRLFEAMQKAKVQETLDELEDDGLVYTSVDKQGNIVKGLTKEGKRYAKQLQTDDYEV